MAKNSVKVKMVSVDLQVVWQSEDKSLHIAEYPFYPQIEEFETAKAKAIASIGFDGKVIKFVKGKKTIRTYEIPLADIIDSFGTIARYEMAE